MSIYNKVINTFENQDTELSKQIFEINKNIRTINRSSHASSPAFSSGLYKKSKYRVGYHRDTKYRCYYNFNLHRDGIHSGQSLAWKNIKSHVPGLLEEIRSRKNQ
jgi:hypothetical protein